MHRLTQQSLRILKVFVEDAVREFAGADIIKTTGLLSGTVYPILLRFEQLGLLEARWEDVKMSSLRRPRRRIYRLTAQGASVARSALRELSLNGHPDLAFGGAL